MNHIPFMILAGALLLLAALAFAFTTKASREAGLEWLANTVTIKSVNTTHKGIGTALADNPFTARYLIAKMGTDTTHIDLCGASDVPWAVVPDMTPSTDASGDATYPLPYRILGLNEDTERMIASGASSVGDLLVPDTGGKVKTLPATAGLYWVLGTAKTASLAAGDMLEVAPCTPRKVIVAATYSPTSDAVVTTSATNSSPYGFSQAQANDIITTINEIVVDLAALKVLTDAAGITKT